MLANLEEKSVNKHKMTQEECTEETEGNNRGMSDEKTQEQSHFSKSPASRSGEELQRTRSTQISYENYRVLSILIAVVSVLTILFIAADECRQCFNKLDNHNVIEEEKGCRKTFWVYQKSNKTAHLSEVFTVLDRLGYTEDPNWTDWDLLWAHDYPFVTLYSDLKNLRPHQKINHFPGCGYLTNKVDLSTSGLKYLPPAFRLPKDKDKLLQYAQNNTKTIFVQKNNDHRNIKIVEIDKVDLNKEGTFVQEYISKPLLVSGHRFDLGIYTVITSIQPLRVYIYNGESILRFCPDQYYPFDPENLNKYVVGDDYLPIWEVPALDYYYNKLGFSMKESLNAYLRSLGKDPSIIWEQVEDAIRTVILAKEPSIIDILKKFKSKRNFFELMRLDFLIDENLNIYLMEANMSPNLSALHFAPNRLMYQQVLFNVLGLVGVGDKVFKNTLEFRSKAEQDMIVSDKDIATYPKLCDSDLCKTSCVSTECHLCKPCMSYETKTVLEEAVMEHMNRGDCKRVFPPAMTQEEASKDVALDGYSPENQLLYRWFRGKCELDLSWC